MQHLYAGRMGDERWLYAAFVLLVLVLNWWVGFSWGGNEHWNFEVFLVLLTAAWVCTPTLRSRG